MERFFYVASSPGPPCSVQEDRRWLESLHSLPLGEAAFTIARMPALIASGRSNQTATLALLAVRKCLVYACLKLLCPRV